MVRAYLATREVMGHVALWQQVEALDNRVPDAVQSAMLIEEGWLTARATTWFLRSRRLGDPMEQTFERFRPAVEAVLQRLAPEAAASTMAPHGWRPACRRRWRSAWPAPTASTPRSTSPRWRKPRGAAWPRWPRCTPAWRRGSAWGGCAADRRAAGRQPLAGLAKDALGDDLAGLQRSITQEVLAAARAAPAPCSPRGSGNTTALERAQRLLAELADTKALDLAMLSVALRELRNLA